LGQFLDYFNLAAGFYTWFYVEGALIMDSATSIELADIFRLHGHRLMGITAEEHHIIEQITFCRTAALG
jgi:hypothetical protein